MGSNEKIQVLHFHKRKEGEKRNHMIKCQMLQVVPLPYSPLAFHSLFLGRVLSRPSYQLHSTAWSLNLISGCLSEQGLARQNYLKNSWKGTLNISLLQVSRI